MADLTTDLGKLKLNNPVMTASGTFGYGFEYADFYSLDKLGAVVVKGIAPFQSHGNPTPRVAEVTSGMLNAIGL
jgi:dihydroorotate dehydrogenase (NAD+) catalytic subunit